MLRKITSFFDGILDRIFSIIGAVAFSQVPEFIQQYIQRLGGHVDEAQHFALAFYQFVLKLPIRLIKRKEIGAKTESGRQ